MKRRSILLVVAGCIWLTADLYVMTGNMILRETRLGVIAHFLDRLPPAVSNPIFIFLWAVFLLGWSPLLVFGFKGLLRSKGSS